MTSERVRAFPSELSIVTSTGTFSHFMHEVGATAQKWKGHFENEKALYSFENSGMTIEYTLGKYEEDIEVDEVDIRVNPEDDDIDFGVSYTARFAEEDVTAFRDVEEWLRRHMTEYLERALPPSIRAVAAEDIPEFLTQASENGLVMAMGEGDIVLSFVRPPQQQDKPSGRYPYVSRKPDALFEDQMIVAYRRNGDVYEATDSLKHMLQENKNFFTRQPLVRANVRLRRVVRSGGAGEGSAGAAGEGSAGAAGEGSAGAAGEGSAGAGPGAGNKRGRFSRKRAAHRSVSRKRAAHRSVSRRRTARRRGQTRRR